MSSLPPLDVSLSSRRMACVLDGELALSRQGLLFAMRLAQEADVWLFRALWQTLDNSYMLRDISERDPGSASNGREAFPSPRILQQWEMARLETDLGGLQLFFVGDARHESFLPKDIGKDLVRRFELFSEELDKLHRQPVDEERPLYELTHECRRDTAALAAALVRHRPLVFSRCQKAESPGIESAAAPPLCVFLQRCGIECRFIAGGRQVASIRSYLQPIFARTGLAELLWDMEQDGQGLAVVHIVAPHALVVPVEADFDRRYEEEIGTSVVCQAEAPVWFYDARAYWWKYA
jgi:hypothetical protein